MRGRRCSRRLTGAEEDQAVTEGEEELLHDGWLRGVIYGEKYSLLHCLFGGDDALLELVVFHN